MRLSDEQFEEIQGTIISLTHRTHKKNGGDWDEWYSEACLLAVEAADSWEASRGTKLNSWVYFCVWTGLADLQMQESRWQAVNQSVDSEEDVEPVDHRRPFVEWLLELTEDAQYVTRVILEPPAPLAEQIRQRPSNRRTFRVLIRDHLLARGWSRDAVQTVFDEIAAAV